MPDSNSPSQVTWISGPTLRARWDNMPTSTFYYRLKKGLIPKPRYPFGPDAPYWSAAEIEAFEAKAMAASQAGE